MEIVVEKIPDEADVAPEPEVTPEPIPAQTPEPTPKKRGRPPGSKNKPKIVERDPPPLVPEPVHEEVEEEPPSPKKKRAARLKQHQNKKAPRTLPGEPHIGTPLQVAANMLEILRLEQAERQYRKGQLYTSWIK